MFLLLIMMSVPAHASDTALVPQHMVQTALECASRESGLPFVDTPIEARVSWQSTFRKARNGHRLLGEFLAAGRDENGAVTHPAIALLAASWQLANQDVLAHELTHFLQAEHGIDPLSDESEAQATRVGYACR